MENPFVFGIPVSGEHFTGRTNETDYLVQNFISGKHTVIFSHRHSGKTSLISNAAAHVNEMQDNNLRFVRIDVSFCRSRQDFLRLFAVEMFKQSYDRWDERAEKARRHLSPLMPNVRLGLDPEQDFSIESELKDEQMAQSVILTLPMKIAEDTHKKMIICIDEFQQLAEFRQPLQFLKLLRHEWQNQNSVTWCFSGSNQQEFRQLFQLKKMPFFAFGEQVHLENIDIAEWIPFICNKFEQSGKLIPAEMAKQICLTVESHSYYVQQLSWLVWGRTTKIAGQKEFMNALEDLLLLNKVLFQKMTASLTAYHFRFLQAMLDGHEKEFTSAINLKKYDLGSSANVARIKQALDHKEIIVIERRKIRFSDPVFKLWLRKELTGKRHH
jgi:uncharacterized protein